MFAKEAFVFNIVFYIHSHFGTLIIFNSKLMPYFFCLIHTFKNKVNFLYLVLIVKDLQI